MARPPGDRRCRGPAAGRRPGGCAHRAGPGAEADQGAVPRGRRAQGTPPARHLRPCRGGKSRLGWEFEKYVDGLAATTWWHRGRCLSYGDGVAYWALAQAVRQRLGIAEEDPAEVLSAKLAQGLERIVPDPAEREFVSIRMGRLLGVPVAADPGTTLGREELYAGWRLFFERLASSAPVVWVVEDAQHADPALLGFLDHLVDWLRGLPVFVLVLTRPELTQAHPGFGVGRNRTALALDPLDPESMRTLVEALVPGMPAASRELVVEHAEGLPLFAVETVRSLVDRDLVRPVNGHYRLVGDLAGGLPVPESLRGLLAARLDALPTHARALVGDAAVLGTSFPASALVAVSGQQEELVRTALTELVRREVLEVATDPLSPQRGEFQFTQGLLRQVAYETLSRRDRKARHLAVAQHLRATFADDGAEVADAVARHYRDALAAVPDEDGLAELRRDATEMTLRAARRAEEAGAPAAAAAAYRCAAELALTDSTGASGHAAPGWLELASQQARIAGRREDAVELAQQARALHEAAGDRRSAARTGTLIGYGLAELARLAEARAELEAAVEVLREEPDKDTVEALTRLAGILFWAGDTATSTTVAMQALDLADAVAVDDSTLGTVLLELANARSGDNRRLATLMYEQAATLAERAGNRRLQAHATLNLGDLQAGFDWAAAERASRASIELHAAVGDLPGTLIARGNLVEVLLVRGDWAAARELLDDTAAGADGLVEDAQAFAQQALLAGLTGDQVLAQTALDRLDSYRGTETLQDKAGIALADAAVAWGEGDLRSAVTLARAAILHAESFGLWHDVVRWAWPLASRAARLLDDHETVRELLARVDGRRPGHVPPILRAEADLARAHLLRLDDPAAAEAAVLLDRAVDALRAVPAPYFLAGALFDRGQDDDLTEGLEIVERFGAQPLSAQLVRATSGTRRAAPVPAAPQRSAH